MASLILAVAVDLPEGLGFDPVAVAGEVRQLPGDVGGPQGRLGIRAGQGAPVRRMGWACTAKPPRSSPTAAAPTTWPTCSGASRSRACRPSIGAPGATPSG